MHFLLRYPLSSSRSNHWQKDILTNSYIHKYVFYKKTIPLICKVTAFYLKREKIFKSKPSKICGRQPLKKLNGYAFKFLKGCIPQILLGPLANTLSQMQHWAEMG